MIEAICRELNNYFDVKRIHAEIVISNGDFTEDFGLKTGQYFRIIGSVFNDGVYQYGSAALTDESFRGAVWLMAVPPAVISLAEEIKTWTETNEKALDSVYQSESFGGYSYSLKAGENGGTVTWQSHFKDKMKRWRKICPY